MKSHSLSDLTTGIRRFILYACAALLFSTQSYAVNRIHTPGQFSTNSVGAATYTVPIEVPPGTNGLAPKLSLEYNSQRGDGLLGVGWALGGLQVITRCPQTMSQDGVRGRVSFDENDRFCLGGQRLMLESGTYGVNGAEYRTESETFAKIISYGNVNNGPAWFKVWTKDGRILEFGNSSSSQITGFGYLSPVISWAVNKVSDASTNYYTVSYAQNTSGVFWPVRIDYTGNDNTGLAPYNSVEFLYFSPRPNGTVMLPNPYQTSNLDVLLGGIRTKNTGAIVKDYWLSFNTGAATSRIKLTAVTECGGGSSSYCLPPTRFEWQEPTVGPQNFSWTGGTGVGAAGWRLADLFGDGRKVYYSNNGAGTHYATQVNADGTKQTWTWTGGHGTANGGWQVGDLFGDGREVFYTFSSSGTHYATQLNRDGTVQNWTWTGGHGAGGTGWKLADLFGDGRQLYYTHASNGTHYATRLNPDGTVQNWTWSGGHTVKNAGWRTANLFGDGRKLFYSIQATVGTPTQSASFTHYVTRLNPDGTRDNFSHTSQKALYNQGWDVADIFGDGRDAFFMQASTGERFAFRVSPNPDAGPTKLAISNYGFGATSPVGDLGWRLVDLFGDGRKVYYTHWSNGQHYAVRLDPLNPSPQSWTWTGGHGVGNAGWEMGDLFGDGRASYYTHSTNGTHYVTRFSSAHPDVITKVTSGLTATIDIAYKPLTDNTPDFYTKDTDASYPIVDLRAPIHVVQEVSKSNGIGGYSTDTYSYKGVKSDLDGRGFLGFREVSVYNDVLQTTVSTEYRQDWPYIGLPSTVTKSHPGGNLNRVTNTYAATNFTGSRYFPYLAERVEQSWDTDGTPLPTVTTSNQYDCTTSLTNCYGNLTQSTRAASDGYSKTAVNTYSNDVTNWFIGRLTHSAVSSGAITRTTAYEYNAQGLRSKKIIEPDTIPLRLETAYVYSGLGNVTSTTVSSPATGEQAIQSRTSSAGYDSRGRFPTSVSNALGHTETRQYDSWFGVVFNLTGPNSLSTLNYYNDLGLMYKETKADGTITRNNWYFCSTCTENPYYVWNRPLSSDDATSNGAWTKTYYDSLDRVIRRETQGFDGSGSTPVIVELTEYDAAGRVARTSRPFIDGSSNIQWTSYTYDVLGRVTSTTRPDNSYAEFDYNGLVTKSRVYVSAGQYQLTTTTFNSRGEKLQITDDLGQSINSSYDGFGNLQSVTVASGSPITMQYDTLGRKTQMVDPDKGTWTYVYNAVGELVKQTNARNQITTMTYDNLGRRTQRTEPDLVSSWYFDTLKGGATCSQGIGKLCEVETNNGYSRVHSYDSLGRPTSTRNTIDGTYIYTASVTYDANGRVNSQTYPTNFKTKTVYTPLGYPQKVTNSSGTTVYWQADSIDAEGGVTQATLGNGLTVNRNFEAETGRLANIRASNFFGDRQNFAYTYDWLDNMLTREDIVKASLENASYDSLSRLLSTSGATLPTLGFEYSDNGNLTYKSDTGTYSYSAGGARPHAVTQITGSVNTTFTYDANGNVTSGNGRTLTWTSYDLPATITRNGQTSSFVYDADHERSKQVSPNGTTHYVNPAGGAGLFYERTQSGYQTTHRQYISVAGQVVAVVEKKGFTEKTYYWHTDNLGSLAVITDQSGNVQQRCDYDAFGKRTCDSTPLFSRGFTGHEHLYDGLIHMNGRVYDPQVGRFLSADPFVANPDNAQSYNRYSYVENSSFKYVDPTGFAPITIRITCGITDCGPGVGLVVCPTTCSPPLSNSQLGSTLASPVGSNPGSSFNAFSVAQSTNTFALSPTGIGFGVGNPGFDSRTIGSRFSSLTTISGRIPSGFNPNDTRGGFNASGESLVFHPDNFDPNTASLILIIAGSSVVSEIAFARAVIALRVGSIATKARIPVVSSAQGKLASLAEKFGTTIDKILEQGLKGKRFRDLDNSGNINIFASSEKFMGSFRGR
ncbi:RHS repeat-associated core domain-containing protein [Sulfuriflexus sp.]|uniref:RHS repeat-associated core domain-containing protein n=1 Tax=Sulfuriflexus sp. TaxID=2015443 RepID=UPI0028CE3203|nr:RHS repeat-associated core domain-containing protein [Sulfuriflexus sp.]MDT8405174.1 RHS repeat-associated core domain-containing protein [Sulfuriflexus sp.]